MTQYEQGYTGTNGHKAIDHDELARAWIADARQGRFPHAPPPGKWYKVLASLLNIHETYGKDAMEATIQSYAQNTKSYPGFADVLKPKKQPESPPAREDEQDEPLIPPLPEPLPAYPSRERSVASHPCGCPWQGCTRACARLRWLARYSCGPGSTRAGP